jgi:hypothetical protein
MTGEEWRLEEAASLPQLVRLLEWEQGSVPKRKPEESEVCYENRLRKMLATIRRSVDAIG